MYCLRYQSAGKACLNQVQEVTGGNNKFFLLKLFYWFYCWFYIFIVSVGKIVKIYKFDLLNVAPFQNE